METECRSEQHQVSNIQAVVLRDEYEGASTAVCPSNLPSAQLPLRMMIDLAYGSRTDNNGATKKKPIEC
jgi:hypothetical protein